jgi:hypothetical protein
MKEIRPTEKALLAIADLCPIIATSWIDKIEEDKDSTKFLLPAIHEHQPPYGIICVSLPQRPSFLPMPRRRNVLSDMTFYVFSEQQVSSEGICLPVGYRIVLQYNAFISSIECVHWFRNVREK